MIQLSRIGLELNSVHCINGRVNNYLDIVIKRLFNIDHYLTKIIT